jgi:sarcosine oxidase
VAREADAIVIGLGGLGSAAAYWLARRGRSVLGLEQFEIGHERGESQDHSRIIRRSYHTPAYVRLADAAYAAWAALEADLGEPLIVRTGGLDLYPAGGAIPMAAYVGSMDAAGVPYDLMDAGEAMRRWPELRLAADVVVCHQADAGIAPAARCNAAHRRLAREHGAELRDRVPVTAIEVGEDEVVVEAGGRRHRAARLVLAAGPWTGPLLARLGVRLPLAVTREQVLYFATPHLDAFTPDRFPVWIWMDEPSFYGFPAYGLPATKAAWDAGGYETTADARGFEPDAENARRVREFVARTIPRALGPELVKTCLYTLPPDRDFVLDTLPGAPAVAVAVGAGHAFKFASLIGSILADLAIDGATAHDLAPFAIDRPLLRAADPPRAWTI